MPQDAKPLILYLFRVPYNRVENEMELHSTSEHHPVKALAWVKLVAELQLKQALTVLAKLIILEPPLHLCEQSVKTETQKPWWSQTAIAGPGLLVKVVVEFLCYLN